MTFRPNAPSIVGLVLCGLVPACPRYRAVPVTEAPKLSSENVPPSGAVVVADVEGRRVRIERFRVRR